MAEQSVGSWSETDAMRRALCKALAIRPDTSWEDAIEDARNAGIVRDAEYRAHDRISDRNEVLSSLLRGMARRVGTLRGNGRHITAIVDDMQRRLDTALNERDDLQTQMASLERLRRNHDALADAYIGAREALDNARSNAREAISNRDSTINRLLGQQSRLRRLAEQRQNTVPGPNGEITIGGLHVLEVLAVLDGSTDTPREPGPTAPACDTCGHERSEHDSAGVCRVVIRPTWAPDDECFCGGFVEESPVSPREDETPEPAGDDHCPDCAFEGPHTPLRVRPDMQECGSGGCGASWVRSDADPAVTWALDHWQDAYRDVDIVRAALTVSATPDPTAHTYLEAAAAFWQARAERYAEVLRQVSDSFRTATFSDYLPPEPPVGAEVRNSAGGVVWARRDDGWHCALNVACTNCPTDWEEAWERTGRPFSVVLPAAVPAATATTEPPAEDWRTQNPAHARFCDGSCEKGAVCCPAMPSPLIGTWADPEFRAHQDHKHAVEGCGYCPSSDEENAP